MSRHRGGPRILCPHCDALVAVRSSQKLGVLYREITFSCRNELCGHVFVCGLEVVRTLSPSATPNAEINIPFAKSVRRNELAAQLKSAPETT